MFPEYINFSEIADSFLRFITRVNNEKSFLDFKPDAQHSAEIEMTLYKVGLEPVSYLKHYAELLKKSPDEVIQIFKQVGVKEMRESSTVKIRGYTKKKLETTSSLSINQFVIQDDDLEWDRKEKMVVEDFDYGNFAFSIEKKKEPSPIKTGDHNFKKYLMISTELIIGNIIIRHRSKFIKNKDSSDLLRTESFTVPYIELELVDPMISITKQSIINALQRCFGTPIGIVTSLPLRPPLKTFSDPHQTLLSTLKTIEGVYDFWITPKYDGHTCYFEVSADGMCRYNFGRQIRISKTNLPPTGVAMSGYGEVFLYDYDGYNDIKFDYRMKGGLYADTTSVPKFLLEDHGESTRNRMSQYSIGGSPPVSSKKCYIAPFYIESITMDNVTVISSPDNRIEMLQKYNKYLHVRDDSIGTLVFIPKPLYGPVTTVKDIADVIATKYGNEVPTDGLIILNVVGINSGNNPVDYKIKLDDTVDILTVVELKGGFRDQDGYARFKFPDHDITMVKTKCLSETQYLYFPSPGNTIYEHVYVPPIFISEFSIKEHKIITPRIDKVDRLFSPPLGQYKGNQSSVIQKIMRGYKNNQYYSLDKFEQIANDTMVIESSTQYYYTLNITKGATANLCNLLKTNLISNSLQKLTTQREFNHVLGIDFGQGGDLYKYLYAGIKHLLATDPDSRSISECITRYEEGILRGPQNTTRSNAYVLNTLVRMMGDDDYILEIKKMHQGAFDVIDWQFAIHFAWGAYGPKKVVHVLDQLSGKGTRLLISFLDSNIIDQLIPIGTWRDFNLTKEDGKNEYKLRIFNNKDTLVFTETDDIKDGREESKVYMQDLVIHLQSIRYQLVHTIRITEDFIKGNIVKAMLDFTFEQMGESKTKNKSQFNSTARFFQRFANTNYRPDDWIYMSFIVGCAFTLIN